MKAPFARPRSSDALPGLDHAYQQQLAALSRVRRAVAAAAIAGKQLELQLGQMMMEHKPDDQGETTGGMPRPTSDPRLEALRGRYTGAQEQAQRLFAASQHLQVKIEAFRLAKEATEAAYVEAQDALHAAQAEIGDKWQRLTRR